MQVQFDARGKHTMCLATSYKNAFIYHKYGLLQKNWAFWRKHYRLYSVIGEHNVPHNR